MKILLLLVPWVLCGCAETSKEMVLVYAPSPPGQKDAADYLLDSEYWDCCIIPDEIKGQVRETMLREVGQFVSVERLGNVRAGYCRVAAFKLSVSKESLLVGIDLENIFESTYNEKLKEYYRTKSSIYVFLSREIDRVNMALSKAIADELLETLKLELKDLESRRNEMTLAHPYGHDNPEVGLLSSLLDVSLEEKRPNYQLD